MNKKVYKSLGSLCDIEVIACLPTTQINSPYCYCTYKGNPITSDIITFSREEWNNQETLKNCFQASIGIGISIALQKELIFPVTVINKKDS